MRSREERVRAVCCRVAQMRRQRRLRAITAGAVAASVLVTAVLAVQMPERMRAMAGNEVEGTQAASVFRNGGAAGYVLIGLLAFVLGICVTVLCFRIRELEKARTDEEKREDDHGGADR